MQQLRRLALSHRRFAALLLALALLARAVLPAGYMPTTIGKTLTVAMCNGTGPMTLVLPLAGKTAPDDGGHHDHGDHPCAFSALGGHSLAAADPVLLAAALVFAFVVALVALPLPPLRRTRHIRPPLRGPPEPA